MTDHNLFSVIPYKDRLVKFVGANKALAYYRHHIVDLLTGAKTTYDFKNWIEDYQHTTLSTSFDNPRVIHLFYELGFLIENELHLLNDDSLLVIDIQYSSFLEISPQFPVNIKLKTVSTPVYKDYKSSFDRGYQELLKGNCYQFNLTCPFLYSFEKHLTPMNFISALWSSVDQRGAYGSATFIPFFNKLLLSNSPECLFQHHGNTLSTMPIKGTLKRIDSEDWRPLWKTLSDDKKSQAELYMISDLLRNDLSRIEFPRAQIVKKKSPKLVPGLLHQYSQIDVQLSPDVTLWRVIEKVFPGGSITGAPKRRAIRLIEALEKRERGFYCGSTLVLYKDMKSASINIRSGIVDFKNFSLNYQAGGGITLLSKVKDEYKEMIYKRDSFIRTLTL